MFNKPITLESVLDSNHDQFLFHDFRLYLQQTYCIENLLFYQEVQNYHSKPTVENYNWIIYTFIEASSIHEINIPCDTRHYLINNRDYSRDVFDEAAESILELLRVNSFLPWSQQRKNNLKRHRNSLSPSVSYPDRLSIYSNSAPKSRPSFASLRNFTSVAYSDHQNDSGNSSITVSALFKQKKRALLLRVKNYIK